LRNLLQLNATALTYTALTYNKPSNRVIEKCGFNLIGVMDIENKDYFYYKLTKNEYQKGEK